MNIKKFFGWGLLIVGLIIIFWSLCYSYNIFSAKTEPPKVFNFEKKELINTSSSQSSDLKPSSEEELQAQMQKIIGEKIEELIPAEFLSKLFNLLSWSIFVGLLVLISGKLCSIGINLIKNI